MKNINVLVVDDIGVVGECVKKRLARQNQYLGSQDIKVTPYFFHVSSPDPEQTAKELEKQIRENKINFLLLDRGFYTIIDPVIDASLFSDKAYLFGRIKDQGIKVEDILRKIDKKIFKNIIGIYIYTYDEDLLLEEADLINGLTAILPTEWAGIIDVLLTYKDVYHPSGLDLYLCEPIDDEFEKLGRRSDFVLYQAFEKPTD